MDSRKIVYRETGIIALGQIICLALMLGIYALAGFFTTKVLLGGIIGTVLAIANFFFMAMMTQLAADRAENQDVEGGKKLLKASYPIRLWCWRWYSSPVVKADFLMFWHWCCPLYLCGPFL